MRRLSAISCFALLASSTAALGTDLPVKKAPVPRTVQAIPAWTGIYGGAIGGYGWNTFSVREITSTSLPAEDDPVTSTTPFGRSAKANGHLAGVQAGADFELPNRFVIGIAGDWMASGGAASAGEAGVTVLFDAKSIWTVRGRLGRAIDNVLFYGTGGFAAARSTIGLAAPELGISLKENLDRTGWVAGIGAEIRLAAHWRLGAEYRYLSFGTANANFFAADIVGNDDLAVCVPVKWRAHQALVSLNYQF